MIFRKVQKGLNKQVNCDFVVVLQSDNNGTDAKNTDDDAFSGIMLLKTAVRKNV